MDPEDREDFATLPALALGRSLWAIRRDVLPRLTEAHRTAAPVWGRLAARAADGAPRAARRGGDTRAAGAVAVLPLTGVLTPRGSMLSMLFGGGFGGLQDFRETFREAVASPDVGAIVLDVDSPGGLIDLVPETAAEVREARGSKPIVAVANTMAASGAYWIAAQADEIVVTPSGEAGSIGVYMVHEDWSAFNEQAGIQPTYISAGRYKTEGNPDEPLSEESHTAWQQEVDDIYGQFVDDVAAGRGVSASAVRSDYGEGRSLLAGRALEAGMVDRIDTLETVVGELLDSSGGTGRAAAARLGRVVAPAPRAEVPEPVTDPVPPPTPISPPANDPTHVPDDAPVELDPPADPVEPDVGPDAPEPADVAARAAMAALLVG